VRISPVICAVSLATIAKLFLVERVMISRAYILLVASISAPAIAAEKLNLKLGLWEITSSTETRGMPPLPKEILDKMTPQQRKKMEAELRAEQAAGPALETDRECVTQSDLDRPFEVGSAKECTHTIITSTRTSQEVRIVCSGGIPGSGSFKMAAPTPEKMSGTMDLKLGAGAEAMTVRAQLQGKWLSSDCGDEADDEDEAADSDPANE
jgi:Protein of unknown function (DUF3617)